MLTLSEAIDRASTERFNAFATLTPDRAQRRQETSSQFAGVPFAVKENIAVAGVVKGCGSKAFADCVASEDAAAVQLLESAGARVIGTTTMQELGCGIDRGVPRAVNPRAPSRTAGGSSGGSAAAVAAGIVPFALGTDGAGSVRTPAAFCGVVGLKPSHGLLPTDGVSLIAPSLETVGIIAQSTTWVGRVVRVLAPTAKEPAYLARPLELGCVEADSATTTTVRRQLEIAISRLDKTAILRRVDLPQISEWQEPLLATYSTEAARTAESWPHRLEHVGDEARATILAGRDISTAAHLRAQQWRARFRNDVDHVLSSCDAIVLPTVDFVAHEHDPTPEDDVYWGESRWTAPFNLSGHPAVSVPIGLDPFPVSLQVVGRRGDDLALVAAATHITTALGLLDL